MMDELRELYQEVILDHGRRPRNFRRPEGATCEAKGDNPLCGDRLAVFLDVDDVADHRHVVLGAGQIAVERSQIGSQQWLLCTGGGRAWPSWLYRPTVSRTMTRR